MKENKQCCVRIPEELHRRLKLAAYEKGWNMQTFLIDIITNTLDEMKELEEEESDE